MIVYFFVPSFSDEGLSARNFSILCCCFFFFGVQVFFVYIHYHGFVQAYNRQYTPTFMCGQKHNTHTHTHTHTPARARARAFPFSPTPALSTHSPTHPSLHTCVHTQTLSYLHTAHAYDYFDTNYNQYTPSSMRGRKAQAGTVLLMYSLQDCCMLSL
jgi:hypothetical protein